VELTPVRKNNKKVSHPYPGNLDFGWNHIASHLSRKRPYSNRHHFQLGVVFLCGSDAYYHLLNQAQPKNQGKP